MGKCVRRMRAMWWMTALLWLAALGSPVRGQFSDLINCLQMNARFVGYIPKGDMAAGIYLKINSFGSPFDWCCFYRDL